RQLVDVHLLPRSRDVELTTVPAGAVVFLDDQLVAGKTPLSFAVTEGEYHALRIEKPGYETVTKKLKPDDNIALEPIVLEQEKEPRGTVYVDAAGPAAVWIDGQYSGFMTPTPGLRVSAGVHAIELRDAAGKILDAQHPHIDKGETARLTLQIKRAK
ncbi:MAG TPA: PEGA domain-containing protein, partial [Polyangia bacterium]